MSGYRAKKRFGQNFLISPEIIDHIVTLIDPKADENIVEIGPGRGALTLPLAESGANIWGVEFDHDLIGYLDALLRKYKNVQIINEDFLKFIPFGELLTGFKLVGNLPYNITSPVIDFVISNANLINSAVFMVQRELGKRLTASVGTKDYSPITIFTQLIYDVDYSFDVSPKHFRPPPDINSAVISLTPKSEKRGVLPPGFDRLVRTSFRMRRKQLVNNLVPTLIPDSKTAVDILEKLSLDRKIRAESTSVDQFLSLTRLLSEYNLL